MSISSYKDLTVWQKAMTLCEGLYQGTRTFPREEIYGLTSQIRRAGVSMPANVAEGWGRQSTGDYIHFLKIAQGSAMELETELLLSLRLGLLQPSQAEPLLAQTTEVQKMLRSLIGSLQRKQT
jgi:four helix bundle protein